MSVDAETYIVISLMFAVFAAVAAVGSSMVLGAGFERLRAGFDVVRRQSGFFADAIHKLDQRTQKLDEETAKLKTGFSGVDDRMTRVEKQVIFVGDAISSIEHRILQGMPTQEPVKTAIRMQPVSTPTRVMKDEIKVQTGWVATPTREQINDAPSNVKQDSVISGLFREFPENTPMALKGEYNDYEGGHNATDATVEESQERTVGLTTLISRYWTGEQSGSGKSVIYH